MKNIAPYQILFPLGILSSLLAVGVWIFQGLGLLTTPAIFIHSKLIIGGFLWAFIVGFLMTAIPKMTATVSCRAYELVLAVLLTLSQMIFSWQIDSQWFYRGQIAVVLSLMIFGGRRVFQSKKKIPVFFSHVALAMLLTIVGSVFYLDGNNLMGIHLYHVGPILLLVLGIGTRFFSFLSGLPSEFEGHSTLEFWGFHGLGLLMASLLYLAGGGNTWAYLSLSVVSLFYLVFVWKVFRKSARPSALKIGVRVVALMIPASFLMCWIQPAFYLTWLHLLFIGCFSLITYSVATRVTLAHGAYSTDLEMKSPSLWIFVCLIILATVFRVLYGLSDDLGRDKWLHLAATFWILAITCWCFTFAKMIFIPGDQTRPSC
jgi:uncharacterized protein involved in response to NO